LLIAHFRFLKRANERLLFLSLFAKEQMSERSFFALFKIAMKRAIALLLFFKERMSNGLLNRSFEKNGNER